MSTNGILLVVDLEAACWRGRPPRGMTNEIIEIGVTSIDTMSLEIIKSDTILVKPYNAKISSFCTELTGITPELLDDQGVKFKRAIQVLQEKFGPKRKTWGAWGDDNIHFENMCRHWNLTYPFSPRYINLKTVVSSLLGTPKELGVKSALDLLGMEFEGDSHRAYYDAYNTARIVLEVWKRTRLKTNQ